MTQEGKSGNWVQGIARMKHIAWAGHGRGQWRERWRKLKKGKGIQGRRRTLREGKGMGEGKVLEASGRVEGDTR